VRPGEGRAPSEAKSKPTPNPGRVQQRLTPTPKAVLFQRLSPALKETSGNRSRVIRDGRKADDREPISRIRLTWSDSGFPGQTCGLPGMTVWRGKPGFVSFLLVFVSGSSGLTKQAQGWRLFLIAGARAYLSDSAAAEPMRKGSAEPAEHPGPRGKRQAERSDVRQEYVRFTKPVPVSSLDKRTGASPSCLGVSHDPCLFDASLPFCSCEAKCGRFPSGALTTTTPFIQRWDHHAIVLICKEYYLILLDIAVRALELEAAAGIQAGIPGSDHKRAGAPDVPIVTVAERLYRLGPCLRRLVSASEPLEPR
jgi:hypothetical protein